MIEFLSLLLIFGTIHLILAIRSTLPTFPKCPIRRRHRHSGVTYVGRSVSLSQPNTTRDINADLAADVAIHNHGSFWSFAANTPKAQDYLDETARAMPFRLLRSGSTNNYTADTVDALSLSEALESNGFFVHFHQTPKGQQ